MKKILLKSSICLCVMGAVMTQNTFAQKPSESTYSLETRLTGLTGGQVAEPGINLRYFMSETMAIRLGFGYNSWKNTDNPSDTSGSSGTWTESGSDMTISPGIEFHMEGTDRLSPYMGFGISIGMGSENTEGSNATDAMTYMDGISSSSEMPTSTFGWDLIAGADYYFAESFYVGVELSLGGETITSKEGDTSSTSGGTTTSTTSDESKEATMGVSSSGGIRLGWRF
jgi:opacity protein-like surface antigen